MNTFKIVVASTINGFIEAEEIVKEVTEKKDVQLIWHPDSDRLQEGILSLCEQEISECSCMLTVIGHRYSDFLPGKQVSLGHAQAEFALARSLRPHLAFKLPSTQGTEALPAERHNARHRLVKDLQTDQVLNEPFDLDQFEKSFMRALTWLLIESRQARKIVLVSSTFADLNKARTELKTAVENSGIGMPCIMFEDLPKGLSAEDTSRRLAEQAGLYFGLLSDYRGTVIPGKSISYTELEYEAAYSLQRSPIVLFEAGDPNLLKSHEQSAEDFWKTKEFNDLLRERHPPVRQFHRMSQLYRMALDILFDLERNGMLNRDTNTSPRDETLEPQPPKPFFVQEYSLAVETNLIGRESELRALDGWLYDSTSPHFGARIYCIDAAGGMGKSALVRNWLDRLLSRPTPHFEAVVWFSFYAVETGFDIMAESVLPYLLRLPGLDHIRDADISSLEKMLRIVEERRILLVLDGLERRMKLYTTFRARGYEGRDLTEMVRERVEYHRHLFLSEWPDDVARQLAEEDCYRMTDEESEVLRRLAQPGRSRVLITSRFFPTDLQHRQTKPSDVKIPPDFKDLDGVARLTLEPFDLPKARELAVALELPWQKEFSALHGTVGGYPLYLALAFAFAARGKDSPEEFRRRVTKIASALKGDAEEARKAVVTLGINDLSYEQQEILYEVEFCPIATNFVGLRRVLCGPTAIFERPSELEANLQVLHARKLLGWDRQTGTCDMHPVVRHAVRHFGDQPTINQRIIDRHGGDSHKALIASNVAMLNERLSEKLLLFNAIMRKEKFSEKSFLEYLFLDDWFRFNSSQIDKRLEYLEDFHQHEFKYTVPARIQLLSRLADTYHLKAQLDVAHRHAVRAFELASHSGDQTLIQMACLECSSIAYSQARGFDQDRFLRTAAQHDIFSSSGSYCTWLLCSQVAVSASALRKEEASNILSYLRSNNSSHADVIKAEFNMATAVWPMDDKQKNNLEEILARFRRQCLSDNLVYGRFLSVVMSAELALLFGETPEYKKLIDDALSDLELTRFTDLRLQLMGKRARLATRRGLPKSALDEGRRARNDALQRGLSYIEAEACLAIAEAHFALNERDPALHFAKEAANLANAGGEPYCLRLLKNQIQRFFIEDLLDPGPEFRPYPANQLSELPPMPPIPEPSLTVVCISDTSGWSDEKLERRYREVLDLIDWANTSGSARRWWEAFENENANQKASVLKLAEQLAISKATITEFFLAYIYSNTDDIQGNLDYMYYSRLKKSEEAQKKAKQKGEPLPPLAFTPPRAEGSSTGISDSSGWTEEAIRRRLAEVKELLDFPAETESARKWWDAFEKENTQRMNLVLRLAEEIVIREGTIQEFFLAYVYSNTDNIFANLYYFDYTRRKKQEAQNKRQKEAAERLNALLPALTTGHKLPELSEKDLSILANLSDEDIPVGVRERLSELLSTTRDRIELQKEREKADANRRLEELVPQLESSGPPPALTSEDVKVLRLATTDHLPASVVSKLREAIAFAFIANKKDDDNGDFFEQLSWGPID